MKSANLDMESLICESLGTLQTTGFSLDDNDATTGSGLVKEKKDLWDEIW